MTFLLPTRNYAEVRFSEIQGLFGDGLSAAPFQGHFSPQRSMNSQSRSSAASDEAERFRARNMLRAGARPDSDRFGSLPEELTAKYEKLFGTPELFLRIGGTLLCIPAGPL